MLLAGSYSFFSTIYVNVVAPPKFLSSKAVQYRFLQIKLPEITYNYYYSDFQKDILKYKSLSIYQDFVENENGAAIYLNDLSFSNLELTEGRHFLAEDKENKTKATAANCYTKHSGSFVKIPEELALPILRADYYENAKYLTAKNLFTLTANIMRS